MNNDDGRKVKQINRVATPIKLDASGQRIESDDNPVILTTEQKTEIIETRKKEEILKKIEEKEKRIEEHDPSTAIFVVLLLIILAVLVAFTAFYIIPQYKESQKYKYDYNDKTGTTSTTGYLYQISSYTLMDTVYINSPISFELDKFKINVENNGVNLSILINGKEIVKTDMLIPKVGLLDDMIMFMVQENKARTSKLFIVDDKGNIIKEYYTLNGKEGMVLLPDSSSVIYNNINIVLLGSRVLDNKLILDNTFGNVNGLDICNLDLLNEKNIDDSFLVMGTYSIEYLGNHKFTEPKLLYSTSLSDYKASNKLCLEN